MALVLLILIAGMGIGYTLRIYHESIVDAYYRANSEDEERMNAGRGQDENVSKVKSTPKFAKRFHAEPVRKRPGAFFTP